MGGTLGRAVGVKLGVRLGKPDGLTLGSEDGTEEGGTLGSSVGAMLGVALGIGVGATLGTELGILDGSVVVSELLMPIAVAPLLASVVLHDNSVYPRDSAASCSAGVSSSQVKVSVLASTPFHICSLYPNVS